MIEYRILTEESDEFPGWVGIACIVDGAVSSVSWAPPEIEPGARLNMDHPEAFDERTGKVVRWIQPTPELIAWAKLDDDNIAAVLNAATERGLI